MHLPTLTFPLVALLLHPLLTASHPLTPLQPRSFSNGPVIPQNFADPTFLTVNTTHYAFATASMGHNIPVATSPDFTTWTISTSDALPTLPSWSSGNTWAPYVYELSPTSYIMYFTATYAPTPGTHCLGYALSSSPQGPYNSTEQLPLICPLSQGGAIDPALFQDSDGTLYLVYKIDGNSLGGGGACGNAGGMYSTPIMLQKLKPDGFTLDGKPVQILDRGSKDGPLIEAPDLILSEGVYYLFFSSNCYNGPWYDTSYATSKKITGPYTKAKKPLLTSDREGNNDGGALNSPGGAKVGMVGGEWTMVFHADRSPADAGTRQMRTAGLKVEGGVVVVS